jgi:NAD(P)-dependent dehydrogenase (short-subunit alcohol dehydrogenase family)
VAEDVRRAALVTGASSGIGFAIASMLRDEGYDCTAVSRSEDKLRNAAQSIGAVPFTADVRDPDACRGAVDFHRSTFGRLDVLVHAAGVISPGSVSSLPLKRWDLQFDVNVRALFVLAQESAELLRASHGLVVNISSIAALLPAPGIGAYAASKAAATTLANCLFAEFSSSGVRATTITPDFVATEMLAHEAGNPLGLSETDMVRVEDCAEAVRLLLRLGPTVRVPQIALECIAATRSRSVAPRPR